MTPKTISLILKPEAGAACACLTGHRVERTDEVASGIIVDFDVDGEPVGIEVPSVSRRLSGADRSSYLEGLAERLFALRLETAE